MPVTAALVVAIALVPLLEWFERRGRAVASSSAGLCVHHLPALAMFAIGSIVIPATDWVAQVPHEDRARSARRSSRCFELYKNLDRFIDRTTSQIAIAPSAADAHGQRSRHRNSMLGLADQLGAAPADPAVLRAAGDLLLPRRLDRDAQENDRQPRQLRGRADHRPGDPAGGRRDLDLSRHDHPHQHRPGRADGAGACGCSACRRR